MFRKKCFRYILFALIILNGCTKLHETFRGDLTEGGVGADSTNTSALLQGVYTSVEEAFSSDLIIWPLLVLSTDEGIAPTRGADWDDNGVWRVFHQQKWPSNNEKIRDAFNVLNGISYAATDLLRYHPTKKEQAEARFIRAWVMYLLLDMFDQVPYRDPGESLIQPARVKKDTAAWNYIVSETNAVEPDLPPNNPVWLANKFAAKVLLMKCYLNKAVYINRADPHPNSVDMDKVISLADSIINSNAFSFSKNYFDDFAPNNTDPLIGRENIFTLKNDPWSTTGNGVGLAWIKTVHYNQYPHLGAANGWTTLSDFYEKFESFDKRRGVHYFYPAPDFPPFPNPGNNVGFLKGQQYDPYTGDSLKIGTGAPLSYTDSVKNIELGANLEVTGIRALKYFPDFPNYYSPGNDYVFFRFADVLLMKAEAILRGGAGTTAGPYGNTTEKIVNFIRTDPTRGASYISPITLDNLLDERGRELWWEGWRRQDLIRFGKFLLPMQEKPDASDPKYLLFPIPDEQLAVNPNLHQNPGY